MESNRDYQEDVKMWLENAAEKTRGEDGGTSIRGVIVPGGVRASEIVPDEFLDKLEGLKRLVEAYHAEDGWTPKLSPTVEAVGRGYQDFWQRTPQAFADFILAEFEGVTRNFCYEVLCGDSSDDIPKWLNILPDASAQEVFSGYDDAGRKVVSDALQSDRLQYSQAYIKAKWVPLVEDVFLENLTDEERIIIRSGIRMLPDSGINRGLVLLFCSIYVKVDDDTQIAMAKAIGLDDNTVFERIKNHIDIPDIIDFGSATRKEDEAIKEESTPDDRSEDTLNDDSSPGVKKELPNLPPQQYSRGIYPLALTQISNTLWGIPLDGKPHEFGTGIYKHTISLTVTASNGFLPFPLDSLIGDISMIIGYGRDVCHQEYFDVEAIARYIIYGNPDAHKVFCVTQKNGNMRKVKKLLPVSKSMKDFVDKLIEYMGSIMTEVKYPVWLPSKSGKKTLQTLEIKRPLLPGGVRVKFSKSGKTSRTYWRKGETDSDGKTTKRKIKDELLIWGFPSIREDGPVKSYAPVLYEMAKNTGYIANIPSEQANLANLLGEGRQRNSFTAENAKIRDAIWRRYFDLMNKPEKEGIGKIDLKRIEEDTGLTDIDKKDEKSLKGDAIRVRHKRRQDDFKKLLSSINESGKFAAISKIDKDVFEIQTLEVREKNGKIRKSVPKGKDEKNTKKV